MSRFKEKYAANGAGRQSASEGIAIPAARFETIREDLIPLRRSFRTPPTMLHDRSWETGLIDLLSSR